MVEIQAAGLRDVPAMVALQRAVLAEGEWFITEVDELDDAEQDARNVVVDAAQGRGLALVARRRPGGPILGWAWVSPGHRRRTRHVGHLEMLVDVRARGAGVGRALLEQVLSRAPSVGLLRVSLCVYAHNTAARALYTAAGFIEEGRSVGAYRFPDGSFRDDILMTRVVGTP